MEWSDFGDAMRAASKERREKNRQCSAQVLQDHGVQFETHNNGVHLIVRHNGHRADLWPGTGKYRVDDGKYRRGVFNLLRDLGVARGGAK